jgi:hypothetical protein
LTCSDGRRERYSLPNAGVHFLLNSSACGQNGVVAVSLSTKLRWFRRGAAAFERTFPGLVASTLGKEFGAACANLRQSVRPAPNTPLVIRSKINRTTSPNSTPLSDDRDVARGEVSVRRAAEPARVPVPLAIVRHAGQNRCRQRVHPRCRTGRPPPGAENGRYGQPARRS